MAAKPWTPKVGILLLTSRPQYLARAVRCAIDQTYKNTELLIVDQKTYPHRNVGNMRNMGCQWAKDAKCEVIVHWDDDDYSFPGRIERQLQQLAPVHAVGWRELAFWDSRLQMSFKYLNGNPRYACGTSLCYRLEEWQKHPFAEMQVGEDAEWCSHVRPYGMLNSKDYLCAEIHGGNTSSHVDPDATEWSRTPGRDEFYKTVMAL